MPRDPMLPHPREHCVGDELGSVVGDDQIRFAAPGDEGVELARNSRAGDQGVGDRRQTFLGDVVDHVEDPEAPPVRKLVVDEVDRPAGVRPRFDQDRLCARRLPVIKFARRETDL